MKKLLAAIAVAIFTTGITQAQNKILLGQYFQNMPAFNPALTGANDFLDLRMNYRQQWVGFDGAPRTVHLGAYAAINAVEEKSYSRHSIRTSSMDGRNATKSGFFPNVKQGLGGNLQSDEQGPFRQMEINLNYAVHIPVSYRTYLSMGLSPGIYHGKVDFSKVEVMDLDSDQTYLNLLENGESSAFFRLSGGFSLYSDRYYAAYSMMQLAHAHIGGNESMNNEGKEVRHQFMGGYRFYLNQDFELVPNAFVRMEKTMPLLWDAGARIQYKGQFWTGASYRNEGSLIGMLGLLYNDKIRIGYSFEFKTGTYDTFNSASHELVIGLQLFNHSRYVSMW